MERTRAARKLARPFHGLYQVGANTAKIRRVNHLEEKPILVAIDRLRRCQEVLGSDFWPPDRTKWKKRAASTASAEGKSGASAREAGQVTAPADKKAMSEGQQRSVGGARSSRVGSSVIEDVWVDDKENDVGDSGRTDNDQVDSDRTLPGDDVV